MPLEIDYRQVIKSDGKALMGAGRAKLLSLVKKTGSLSTAAKQMGMSYRHAWGVVRHMEEICGEKLLVSVRGGSSKGRSSLTKAGDQLLQFFEQAEPRAQKNDCRLSPKITTDGILVNNHKILLVRRKHDPFKGRYALPGGFVEYGETVEQCVVREVEEETGLKTEIKGLVGVYSDPGRDPRGHTISVVFSLSSKGGRLRGSEETFAEWVSLRPMPQLAFDHSRILDDFIKGSRRE